MRTAPAFSTKLVLAACICLAWASATRLAIADAAESDRLLQEGLELRRAHKDAEALERFRQANAADPSARALAQIALAEQALGRWLEAEEHLDEALRANDAWIQERRAVLEEALEQIRSHIGTLEISVNVPRPEVVIDGEPVDVSPGSGIRLARGDHHVIVRAPGFRELSRSVEVRADAVSREEFTLEPLSLQPEPPESSTAPLLPPPFTEDPPADPHRPTWRRTAAWAALAGAGALLIGAVSAHVVRERKVAVYNDDSRCLQGTLSRKERCGEYLSAMETAETFAVVGYAASATLLGFSVVMFATDPGGSAAPAPAASSKPRSSSALLEWTTSF